MQRITHLRAKNKISDKDIVVYLFIDVAPYKTALELSRLSNRDYTGLTQSINNLINNDLIIKTGAIL